MRSGLFLAAASALLWVGLTVASGQLLLLLPAAIYAALFVVIVRRRH